MPKEISEKTSKLIEAEGISLEVAEGIIDNQKDIIEQFSKNGKNLDPKVIGNGKGKLKEVEEGEGEISDDEYVRSLS